MRVRVRVRGKARVKVKRDKRDSGSKSVCVCALCVRAMLVLCERLHTCTLGHLAAAEFNTVHCMVL